MKKIIMVSALAATVALTGCNKEEKKAELKLDTTLQKVSYGIGLNIAKNFKTQQIEVDMEAFKAGISDGQGEAEPRLTEEEMMTAMQAFQQEQMEKQMAERKKLQDENKNAGVKYLEENAKKDGVKTTESGLQYKAVKTVEEGATPTATDTVKVHYRGKLINGEEFDSSYSRNQPAQFAVNAVIPGWTEALQLMKVGETFEVAIPAELAYGEGGAGAKIGPNATLLFDIELLEIVKPAEEGQVIDAGNSTK